MRLDFILHSLAILQIDLFFFSFTLDDGHKLF